MKKRILVVTDLIPVGGNVTFIKGLVNELKKNPKNKITFIYFCDLKNRPNLPSLISGIEYFEIPLNTENGNRIKILPKRIILLKKIISKLKNQKFDFVFTDLIYPAFAFQIVKILNPFLKKTFVFNHIHGSFSEEFKSQNGGDTMSFKDSLKYWFFYQLEHFVLKNSDKIFAGSQYSLNLTKKLHGDLHLEVNKPGIDHSFSIETRKIKKEIAREKIGLNDNNKYVLFVSRIEPRKGVIDFFENLRDYKFDEDVKFLICSHFFESGLLYDFFDKLDKAKLGSKIILINNPSREQLALLYRASDVTVVPSKDLETFGFTTLESYYYSTPVVAFGIGANSELIPKTYLVKFLSTNRWRNFYSRIEDIIKKKSEFDYSKYNYSWVGYIKKLKSFLNETE